MHILVLGTLPIGADPNFYRGAEKCNFGKIFDRVLNWWLTIPERMGIWEMKNNGVHH